MEEEKGKNKKGSSAQLQTPVQQSQAQAQQPAGGGQSATDPTAMFAGMQPQVPVPKPVKEGILEKINPGKRALGTTKEIF